MWRQTLLKLKLSQASHVARRNLLKWKRFDEVIKPTYLLIPESPVRDERNHPLIDPCKTPNVNTLTADEMFRACSKHTMDFEEKLGTLCEELSVGDVPLDFDYIIDQMEGFTYPLDTAINWCRLKYFINDTSVNKMVFSSVANKASVTKMERWSSPALHQALELLAKNSTLLSEFDRGLLAHYQRQFHLHGIGLNSRARNRLTRPVADLLRLEGNFRVMVEATSRQFRQRVPVAALEEAPEGFVDYLPARGSRGDREIGLDPATLPTFMAYCSDRAYRRNAWEAWSGRAGQMLHGAVYLSNHNTIAEIRRARREAAQELGFQSHAALRLSGFMAGRAEPVVEMLDLYRLKYRPRAEEEVARLTDFASANCPNFQGPLRPWDVPYWTRRLEKAETAGELDRVSDFLPLDAVLAGTFELCRAWFDVQVDEDSSSMPGMRLFLLRDTTDGRQIGTLLLDPFARPNRIAATSVLPIVERSELHGASPVTYLSLQLRPSTDSTLMSLDDVSDFWHALGSALQHLLTRVDRAEVAGQNGVPPDAVHVCGHVFRRLARTPMVLQTLGRHHHTGEPMPENLVRLASAKRPVVAALPLLEELYHAAFDLDMWLSDKFWREVQSQLWFEFMVLEPSATDEWPCAATDIFSDSRDATLYSNVWARTVAGDVISAFEDINIDLDAQGVRATDIRPVMERFRSTFLSLGGAVPAAEVFRRFRGRDPVRTVDIL